MGFLGGEQTRTDTTTIPGASGQEAALRKLLQRLASGAEGQLGDLGALARGQLGGPTGADRALVGETIGAARDMAQRELRTSGALQRAQLGEQLTARGMGGASSESVQRMLQSLGESNQIAQAISQAQSQGAQALMNLPFQRAQTQLSANQALFNRISGAANPVLQGLLQERLAQGTTTSKTKSNPGLMDILNLGSSLGGLFMGGFGGGAAANPAAAESMSYWSSPGAP